MNELEKVRKVHIFLFWSCIFGRQNQEQISFSTSDISLIVYYH